MSSATDSNPDAHQWEALSLANQYRASQGRPVLCLEPHLNQAARNHTIDMSVNSFLSPTGNDGASALERIRAAGYEPTHWGINTLYGENQVNATHAASQWTSSGASSQAALILSTQFTHTGVYRSLGYCPDSPTSICTFWTQIYAAGFSGAQCLTTPASLLASFAQPATIGHDGGSSATETPTGPRGSGQFSPAVILGISIGSVGAMLLSITMMVLIMHRRQRRGNNKSFQAIRTSRMPVTTVKTGRVGVGAWRASGSGAAAKNKLTVTPSVAMTGVVGTSGAQESVVNDARIVQFTRR